MLKQKKNTIYEIYKLIFKSPIKTRQKAIIFSKVYYHMALEINWRVIKVSKNALIHCKKINNFGGYVSGLQRSHKYKRINFFEDTFFNLFLKDKLFKYIYDKDFTYLLTKKEHQEIKYNKNLVLYDVEKNKKIFEARDIGFDTKKENYKYLEKLYNSYLK